MSDVKISDLDFQVAVLKATPKKVLFNETVVGNTIVELPFNGELPLEEADKGHVVGMALNNVRSGNIVVVSNAKIKSCESNGLICVVSLKI